MTPIAAEYQRFLADLAMRPVAENTRRMANLVWQHLSQLAQVGATRRGRSTRLAPLALQDLLATPSEAPPPIIGQAGTNSFRRLRVLTVGPFRGFTRAEVFDLSCDITLVYGANGTGKSSFCEALEAAMLGNISEAQAKRIDFRSYCNNARLRRHIAPTLTCIREDGAESPVESNEEAFRFCFIEKNRLDDFGRIAARTPADQRQLIATLFGLDQFMDFVRGFNPSLDEELNLNGSKAAELARRRTRVAAAEQVIRDYPAKQAQSVLEEAALAQRVQPGVPFQAACDWLMGTAQQPGRLPYVQQVLDAPTPIVYGLTAEGLTALRADAYRAHGLWQTSQATLGARAGEVSYAQLYSAVLKLAEGATACPACGTTLAGVAQDPFERARAGLAQLAELAGLQQEEARHRETLEGATRELRAAMNDAIQAAAAVCPEELQRCQLPVLPASPVGNWFEAWSAEGDRAWQNLLALVALIEGRDAQARVVQGQRLAFAQEREQLDGYRLEIERLRAVHATNQRWFQDAQEEVAQFEQANRALIQDVEAEAAVMAHHQVVKAAYDEYYVVLRRYLDGLPATLLAGLGQSARDLYNAFNRDDPPADLLHALRLPVAENGKIELEFAGERGRHYDALAILSEGHIKCLGLAILLAKNIAQGCPVVVFDDVVNAIDDDHRNGIWRTFFEDGLLDHKQVILTSHAEEFLHRIQQELGAARARLIKRYKFLPHDGEHELRVDADPPTKNYVLLAQAALAADDKRDALRQSRPAIESLTDRLWTWMGRRGDGAIDLMLAGPRSKWELHNKCSKLRTALRRSVNPHPGVPAALAALDVLLGVNGGSIEWGYMNSGTHDAERIHEFDRATVRAIVEATGALDAALALLQGS